MKWFYAFVFAALSLGVLNPGFCQQQPALPSEIRTNLGDSELKQFRRQQLGIQVNTRTQTNITANTYTWLISGTPFLTTTGGKTISTRQIQNWQAYQGFQEIREPEFFRIAGYPNAAREAKEWHTKTSNFSLVSGILFSGLTVASVAVAASGNPEGGIAAGILSAGTAVYGFSQYKTWRDGNWAPYKRAQSVASDYNRNLYEKLTGQTSTGEGGTEQTARLPAETVPVSSTVEETLSLPGGAKKVQSSEVNTLQEGDVIISINGTDLNQDDTLEQVVKQYSPGDTLQVEILREGENQTVSVTLGGSINK